MNKPYLRNPNFVQELPWRKWMRNEFETMPFPMNLKGLNVQDIDLVVVRYGQCAGRHLYADGIIRLFEVKQLNGKMSDGQARMYSMLDRLLRQGDPEGEFYEGFYFLYWEPLENCKLNGMRMNMEDLAKFMTGQIDVAPVDPLHAKQMRDKGLF